MKKTFLILAAVATMLAACNNEESLPVVDEMTDTPIVVNVGIAEPVSRAGMTTDALTSFGLSITNSANEQYSYANVKFEKSGDANSTSFQPAADERMPVWANATQDVSVMAYAPYTAGWKMNEANPFTVAADQTDADNVKNSDILWASASGVTYTGTTTGDITSADGALAINLNHVLSKLVINLTYGSELDGTNPTIAQVKVQGVKLEGNIDLTNGTFTISDDASVTEITAYEEATAGEYATAEGYEGTYEAILPPQTAPFKVHVTLGNGRQFVYEYASSGYEFKGGNAYTLALTVGKEKATIGKVTVNDWTDDMDMGTNGTEEIHPYTFKDNTYTVYTAPGLMEVNKLITADDALLSTNITLGADIELPTPAAGETSNWTPIGKSTSSRYTGKFDGAGHTIKGLVFKGNGYAGLIGCLDQGGEVINLTIADCEIESEGVTGGITGMTYGSITGCTVMECTIIANTTVASTGTGGIAGIMSSESTINGCTVVDCKITGKDDTGSIVGKRMAGTISACYAKNVNVTGTNRTGGIVGNSSASISAITACFAYQCTIDGGTGEYTGEIVGWYDGNNHIDACYYVKKDESAIYSYADATTVEWSEAIVAMNNALGENRTYEWKGESADKASIGLK